MELADVPAGRPSGTGSRTRDRSGAFALPVITSFRFTLLMAAVAASSFFVYQGIYLATPRGPALISLMLRCRDQALAPHLSGLIAPTTRSSRPRCATREGNGPRACGACWASAYSSS